MSRRVMFIDCAEIKNELKLSKLCAEVIKSDKIYAKFLKSDCSCTKQAKIEDLKVNDVCVSDALVSSKISAQDLSSNTLCSRSATINDLCVTNLSVMNPSLFQKYRAAVTITDDAYTLGSNIEWNTVLDDPNGNVSLAPFFYTVPVTGYYMVSYYINSDTLTGAAPITGNPVGLLTLTSNGAELRQFNAPYLAFSDDQHALLSAIVLLNAGDVLRMTYNVIVLDPASGQTNYVGTVSLNGNGLFPDSSGFEIHLLSSMVGTTPPVCVTCPIVEVPCKSTPVDCDSHQGCCRIS